MPTTIPAAQVASCHVNIVSTGISSGEATQFGVQTAFLLRYDFSLDPRALSRLVLTLGMSGTFGSDPSSPTPEAETYGVTMLQDPDLIATLVDGVLPANSIPIEFDPFLASGASHSLARRTITSYGPIEFELDLAAIRTLVDNAFHPTEPYNGSLLLWVYGIEHNTGVITAADCSLVAHPAVAAAVAPSSPYYARVRAIDWNGNIGRFSPIVNLQTGLATSAHIGFQAVTAAVRAEFVDDLSGYYQIDPGADLFYLQVGETVIETLGGTVLVDIEVHCEWETVGANGALRVALYVDGEVVDESGFIPFPCDTDSLGFVQPFSNVITGIGLPTSLPPGRHVFHIYAESVGDIYHIFVNVTHVRVNLLELRR